MPLSLALSSLLAHPHPHSRFAAEQFLELLSHLDLIVGIPPRSDAFVARWQKLAKRSAGVPGETGRLTKVSMCIMLFLNIFHLLRLEAVVKEYAWARLCSLSFLTPRITYKASQPLFCQPITQGTSSLSLFFESGCDKVPSGSLRSGVSSRSIRDDGTGFGSRIQSCDA